MAAASMNSCGVSGGCPCGNPKTASNAGSPIAALVIGFVYPAIFTVYLADSEAPVRARWKSLICIVSGALTMSASVAFERPFGRDVRPPTSLPPTKETGDGTDPSRVVFPELEPVDGPFCVGLLKVRNRKSKRRGLTGLWVANGNGDLFALLFDR